MDSVDLRPKSVHMSHEQLTLLGTFGDGLDPDNRWIKLSRLLPWDVITEHYDANFERGCGGHRPLPARIAFGSLIVQQRMGLTDAETVALIQENPYIQAFLGFAAFSHKPPFDPSLMTHFRKRFCLKQLQDINEMIVATSAGNPKVAPGADTDNDNDHVTPPNPSSDHTDTSTDGDAGTPASPVGTLMMDASCVPADIHFPTDLHLLQHARQLTEAIIDALHEPHIGSAPKPRTYRKQAQRQFKRLAICRSLSIKRTRKGCRQQLRYVERNLRTITKAIESGHWNLLLLKPALYRKLLVIQQLAEQQSTHLQKPKAKIEHRIISIDQPHVRTMYRGKAGNRYEFGAKIAVARDNGFAFLEQISWDAYHEAADLKNHAERYQRRHGHYPQRILADKLYRTKENRKWCQSRGIRLAGPGPGRPPKNDDLRKQRQQEAIQDDADRQPMEGVFGNSKRRYGLNRILTRLAHTSANVIALVMIVLNLERILYALMYFFLYITNGLRVRNAPHDLLRVGETRR